MTGALVVLTACGRDGGAGDGDGDGDWDGDGAPRSSAAAEPTRPPATGDAILIETHITSAREHTGAVVDGSFIGESQFCSGGETSGSSVGPTITTTFDCPDGTLTVEYAPTQRSLVQSATWQIVSGTGAFEGLHGSGWMAAAFPSDDPETGREVFTGTVGA